MRRELRFAARLQNLSIPDIMLNRLASIIRSGEDADDRGPVLAIPFISTGIDHGYFGEQPHRWVKASVLHRSHQEHTYVAREYLSANIAIE